jgi:hypothetical protein
MVDMSYQSNNYFVLVLTITFLLSACATEPTCSRGMVPLGGQVIKDTSGAIKFQLQTADGKKIDQLMSFSGNVGLETYSTLCLSKLHFENIVRRPDLYIVRTFPDGTAYLELKP